MLGEPLLSYSTGAGLPSQPSCPLSALAALSVCKAPTLLHCVCEEVASGLEATQGLPSVSQAPYSKEPFGTCSPASLPEVQICSYTVILAMPATSERRCRSQSTHYLPHCWALFISLFCFLSRPPAVVTFSLRPLTRTPSYSPPHPVPLTTLWREGD